MLTRNGPVKTSVESVLGKVCERGIGLEAGVKEGELWMVRAVSWQSEKRW